MAARPAHRPSADPLVQGASQGIDLADLLRVHFRHLQSDLVGEDDRERAVHRARRHIKSMRGLLRLAWPERRERTGAVGALDRELKRLADHLAPSRDDRVAARTAHALAGLCRGEAAEWLSGFSQAAHDAAARAEASRHGRARHSRAIGAIDARLSHLSWRRDPDAIASSMASWHRRARRRLGEALVSRDAEALHEARTSVVRILVQVEALAELAGGFGGRRHGLDRLRSALGEHHDLALLADRIEGAPAPEAVRAAILKVLRKRQRRLEQEAERLHARWHGPARRLAGKVRERLASATAHRP